MSFWNISKKVGAAALKGGVLIGKKMIEDSKEHREKMNRYKTLSDKDLKAIADTSSQDGKLASLELMRRKKSNNDGT